MGETVRKFRKVFNFQDPDAKGRCCVLIFKVVEGFLTYITTGIFYTEFLRCYGMDSVAAGVLSFIPYIARFCLRRLCSTGFPGASGFWRFVNSCTTSWYWWG